MRFAPLLCALPLLAQIDQPTDLTGWLNAQAQASLAARRAKVAAIKTPAEARARQDWIRSKLLELLTGLPDYQGPLNPRTTGTLDQPGYRIEKVIFDSLPRFPVTGNLYVPKTAGRHPAILFSMGHWNEGKPVAQLLAGNLALQGFVVLVYDPIGQGERQQGYDPVTRAARAGGSVEQHFMAGAAAILAGDNFARYMIWDSKRAIDYLQSRPEVDPEKIGATGCSGGGTQTTFISAIDQRIKVAAPACYIQSFEVLYPGDIGDSEQSWPGFIGSGLDQKDFVEAFAPKPWLIASTEGDFFRPAGAKAVYEEARSIYKLLDAESQISWVVGPGPHGTPPEVRKAIYGWFRRWLVASTAEVPEVGVKIFPDHELWATKTGQVSTDLGARDVVEIIRERWLARPKTTMPPAPLTTPSQRPATRLMKETIEEGLRVRYQLLESEPGLWVATKLIEPEKPDQRAVLMLEPAPLAMTLARQGVRVLTIRARGIGPVMPDWMASMQRRSGLNRLPPSAALPPLRGQAGSAAPAGFAMLGRQSAALGVADGGGGGGAAAAAAGAAAAAALPLRMCSAGWRPSMACKQGGGAACGPASDWLQAGGGRCSWPFSVQPGAASCRLHRACGPASAMQSDCWRPKHTQQCTGEPCGCESQSCWCCLRFPGPLRCSQRLMH